MFKYSAAYIIMRELYWEKQTTILPQPIDDMETTDLMPSSL